MNGTLYKRKRHQGNGDSLEKLSLFPRNKTLFKEEMSEPENFLREDEYSKYFERQQKDLNTIAQLNKEILRLNIIISEMWRLFPVETNTVYNFLQKENISN